MTAQASLVALKGHLYSLHLIVALKLTFSCNTVLDLQGDAVKTHSELTCQHASSRLWLYWHIAASTPV